MAERKITPLYERLSRDDDLEGESNSIKNQKKQLEEYARRHGLSNPVHFTDGETYTLPANTFKRTGDTFVGWNTKADGTGTFYKNKASVKNINNTRQAITLYAQWKNYRPVSYTVQDSQAGPVVFVTNNTDIKALTYITIKYYCDDDLIDEETVCRSLGPGVRAVASGKLRSSEYTSFDVTGFAASCDNTD